MDDLRARVRHKLAAMELSQSRLAAAIGLSTQQVSHFLGGRAASEAVVQGLTAWVEDEVGERDVDEPMNELPDVETGPAQMLPISQGCLSYIRTVFGLEDDQAITVDQMLQCCVLGSSDVVRRLQQMLGQEQPVTLDRLEAELMQLREGQERALHAMTKARTMPAEQAHSIEQCADALLARTTPQVIEQMEVACEATNRQPWEVIAGTMIMWRNDFIGADFTEVQDQQMPSLRVGGQSWSRPSVEASRPGEFKLPSCEVCHRTFQPGPNQHRPRFGCAVCGEAESLDVKNRSERKRWDEGQGNYVPNIRPKPEHPSILPDAQQRLAYIVQHSGLGDCTCGQPQPLEAGSAA